jgi:HK97 family phage major capsid protein
MAESNPTTEEIKVGRQHSSSTLAKFKQMQAILEELMGMDQAEEASEEDAPMPGKSLSSETLIQTGDAVKALDTTDGMTKVGGYLVRFTTKGDTDLTGDRFSPETDFDFDFPGKSTAYFNHGMSKALKKRRLSPVTLTRDEVGVFAEGLLNERDEYEHVLAEMARDGKLGLSSGVPSHLVEREGEGKSGSLITYWPLGKDASYTHTPAESRNVVMPLKSLFTAPVAAKAAEPNSTQPSEVNMTEEEIKALVEKASAEAATKAAGLAVEEFKKSLPATTKAGNAQPRDPNEMPYKNIGEQIIDIRAFQHGQGMSQKLEAVKTAYKALGMNEFITADGGAALQPDFTTALLGKVYNPPGMGTIIADVTTQPVSGNGFRALVVDETSRASSRRGGFIGYWGGEGSTISATKPQFRKAGVDLEKVFAMTYLTDELMADAPALAAFVNREAPNELRFQLEDKIVNGTGAGVPQGLLNAKAMISIAKEAGQGAGTLVTENISKMWARMPAYLMSTAKWYINQELLPQLDFLSIAIGVGGQIVPTSIYTQPSQAFPFGLLKGRPVQPVEYCAAAGTVGDIILAAMGEYFVIDNGGIQSAASIHVAFTTDETALRFTYRVNGFPWWADTMTPYKGANTISPYITLAAR